MTRETYPHIFFPFSLHFCKFCPFHEKWMASYLPYLHVSSPYSLSNCHTGLLSVPGERITELIADILWKRKITDTKVCVKKDPIYSRAALWVMVFCSSSMNRRWQCMVEMPDPASSETWASAGHLLSLLCYKTFFLFFFFEGTVHTHKFAKEMIKWQCHLGEVYVIMSNAPNGVVKRLREHFFIWKYQIWYTFSIAHYHLFEKEFHENPHYLTEDHVIS